MPLYLRERDPVPILQEAGWAPGQVWTGAKNLAATGIRSPDLPARSESLYQLRYPGPVQESAMLNKIWHSIMWRRNKKILATTVTICTTRFNSKMLCFLPVHFIMCVHVVLEINSFNHLDFAMEMRFVYWEVGTGFFLYCWDEFHVSVIPWLRQLVASFSQRWPWLEPGPEQMGIMVNKYALEKASLWVLCSTVKIVFTEGQTSKALGPSKESNAISDIEKCQRRELSLFLSFQ
jgi:hypothetical protein